MHPGVCLGESGMGRRVLRVHLDRFLIHRDGGFHIGPRPAALVGVVSAEVVVVGLGIVGGAAGEPLTLWPEDHEVELVGNALSDLGLNVLHVGCFDVVVLGPDLCVVACPDEARVDVDGSLMPVRQLALYAALDEILHVQLPPDLARGFAVVSILDRARARDDAKARNAGELVRELAGDTIDQICVAAVASILEWQDNETGVARVRGEVPIAIVSERRDQEHRGEDA